MNVGFCFYKLLLLQKEKSVYDVLGKCFIKSYVFILKNRLVNNL